MFGLMSDWPIWANVLVIVVGAGVIAVSGSRLSALADRLADRTGLGEAVVGGLFLGVATSLPGITASVTAALDGYPAMAVANAFGGIAVQTAFLAIADLCYRRINLEHAAASAQILLQSTLLILLMALVVTTMAAPPIVIGHVHPMSVLLFVVFAFGFVLVNHARGQPMWRPVRTPDTVFDKPDQAAKREHLPTLLALFGLTAVVVMGAGVFITHAGGRLTEQTGLSQGVVGGLFLAVSTSLPELVTTIAAVRRGAVTLAVTDIAGGNAFDVLFICVADVVFLGGSIYHAAGMNEVYVAGLALVLNAVLLLGLLRRERKGLANIGFESVAILVLYLLGFAILSQR
jgi:cation:H+ antiporter